MMMACHTQSKISKQEVAKFSVKGDSILYEGNYVAKFLRVEYEYYRGRKTLEISVEKINGDRGLKGAMKAADKSGAKYGLVVGDDELATGNCQLKIMSSGELLSSSLDASDLVKKIGK